MEEFTGILLRSKIYRDPKQHKCEGQFPQTEGIETGNEKGNIAHRDHVWKLGSNASHIIVFGWLILVSVFSSEVLSSSRESLLSSQIILNATQHWMSLLYSFLEHLLHQALCWLLGLLR